MGNARCSRPIAAAPDARAARHSFRGGRPLAGQGGRPCRPKTSGDVRGVARLHPGRARVALATASPTGTSPAGQNSVRSAGSRIAAGQASHPS